jgi:ectoine hydroxylase-related dioxygenase (phytanoyl-CoA dioxygenase family)
MPIETGPTLLTCRSRRLTELGYLAWRRPEFIAYFDKHRSPAAARQGRCGVLQPALFHAAGSNRTGDVKPHRQPAAGLLGLLAGAMERRRSHAHEHRALSGAAGARQ